MLQGVRVLDCGAWGVGPCVCAWLGCLGADVIRLEPPRLDGLYYSGTMQKGAGTMYISSHYNKRNIIVDLKAAEGRKVALRLAETADILIENHPAGDMDKLGLGYESVRAINRRIIYCSSSSYGRTGPLAHRPSADTYMQAGSGFASLTGKPGGRGQLYRYVVQIDWMTSLFAFQGVLLALLAREVTGEGQRVDTSQLEAALALQSTKIADYFATGVSPKPMGSADPNIVPSEAFKTYGGKYITVSVPREEYWTKLCRALGLEKLEHDPRFISNAERVKNRDVLIPILREKFLEEPARWWLTLLPRCDVPCAPCNTYDDVIRDPHITHNRMIVELETPWGKSLFSDFPVKFSRAPRPVEVRSPVRPDANREEILAEIGIANRQGGNA